MDHRLDINVSKTRYIHKVNQDHEKEEPQKLTFAMDFNFPRDDYTVNRERRESVGPAKRE